MLDLIKKSFLIIKKAEGKQLNASILIMLISTVLDIIGLSAIIPIIALVATPNKLNDWKIIQEVKEFFAFTNPNSFSILLLMLFTLFFVAKTLFVLWSHKQHIKKNKELINTLSISLIQSAYKNGYKYFQALNEQKLSRNLLSAPIDFSNIIRNSLVLGVSELSVLLILNITAAIFYPKILVLFIIIIVPILWYITKQISKNSFTIGKNNFKLAPISFKHAYHLIRSYIEIKTYSVEERFIANYKKALQKLNTAKYKDSSLQLYPKRLTELLGVLIISSLTFYFLITNNTSDNYIITLSSFAIIAYRLFPAFILIMNTIVQLKSRTDIINLLYESTVTPDSNSISIAHKTIENFNQLTVKEALLKHNNKVLLSINEFTINQQDVIGIMGPSGSGKSSFVKAIMGFTNFNQGDLCINGVDFKQYSLDNWHHQFGYISMDSAFMDAGIYENVCLSLQLENNDLNKIEECLKAVQLHEFVGQNRAIGENGKYLSSGQKQRLALSRALYFDSNILILDEFTSNIDQKNEQLLLDLIDKLNKTKQLSIVIISHRTEPLNICTKIYAIKDMALSQVEL